MNEDEFQIMQTKKQKDTRSTGFPGKTRSGLLRLTKEENMKRITLLTLAALLAVTTAQAGWWRTYGGVGYDEGRCVQEIDDGYIITGGTHSYGSGYANLWLLKSDTSGNEVWSKTYGVTDSTWAVGYFVRQTQDKGYIVSGRLESDESRIWLLKTNEDGDTVWTREFGEGVGRCVQQTQDGGYIITGRRNWIPSELFLLKTDSLGDSLWMRTYLPDVGWNYSRGLFVEVTDDDGFIVAGLIGYAEDDNWEELIWLVRTDSSGDTLWTFTHGGGWREDQLRCVRQTSSLQYIALANFGLFKLDQEGSMLWLHNYRDGSCVQETGDEGYALTGKAGALLTSHCTSMPDDLWLFKTDNQGDSLWKRTYFGGRSYYLEDTKDEGFIMTGQMGGDLFLLKTDSLGLLGVTEKPIVETDNGWNVPHPIGNYIVLHYNNLPQGFRANVFDVSGRKVDQIRGDGNEGAMTWGINQSPGVYFIQAMDNHNQLKTAKVVLVR